MTRSNMIIFMKTTAVTFIFAGNTAVAADVSQDAIDACIDALRSYSGGGGGSVVYTEFSEANSFVVLQDSAGYNWNCVVSNDGRNAELTPADGGTAPAPAASTAPSSTERFYGPAFFNVQVQSTLNIHTQPSTSAPVVAKLRNGMRVENRGCLDNEGRTWCEVADGDASGWASMEYLIPASGGENTGTANDGGGAMAGSSSSGQRVQFAAGTSGVEFTDTLMAGASKRYILGASNGQQLYFRITANGSGMYYQVFNPDGSFLLDQVGAGQEYRGELWQSGDHVIEVINRGNGTQSFDLIFGIN